MNDFTLLDFERGLSDLVGKASAGAIPVEQVFAALVKQTAVIETIFKLGVERNYFEMLAKAQQSQQNEPQSRPVPL